MSVEVVGGARWVWLWSWWAQAVTGVEDMAGQFDLGLAALVGCTVAHCQPRICRAQATYPGKLWQRL